MARETSEEISGSASGGAFTMTVTGAYFAKAPQALVDKVEDPARREVVANTWYLNLVGTTDRESQPVMDREGYHPSFALAPDWESLDGGKTITHPRFNERPRPKLGKHYGRMHDDALDLTKPLAETPEDPFFNHDGWESDLWVGTTWKFGEVERDFGGTIGKHKELSVVEFLGKGAVSAAAQLASGIAPAQAEAPAAAAPSNGGGVRDVLKALAVATPTFAEFQGKALAVEGVATDPVLVAELLDESKFYAQARS